MVGNSTLLMIGLLCGAINLPFLALNWLAAAFGPQNWQAKVSAGVACCNAAACLGIWADAIRTYFGWVI